MDKWIKAIGRACKNVNNYLKTLWISCVEIPASLGPVNKQGKRIIYQEIIHKKLM